MKFLLLFCVVLFATNLKSKDFRVFQIPNGNVHQCMNCHVSPYGGYPLNDFGNQVLTQGLSGTNVNWSALFNLDADGDGFTNGEELLDPNGEWSTGQGNPGNQSDVTEVWNNESFPASVSWQNYITKPRISPNPSVSNVNISFDVKTPNRVTCKIVDFKGNTVRDLGSNFYSAGSVNLSWDRTSNSGLQLSNGTYLLFIQIGSQFKTEKIVIN